MKKIMIILIGLITVCMALFVLVSNNNNKYLIQDGVMLALTLDGVSVSSFPNYYTKDYTVKVDCSNAKGIWQPVETIINSTKYHEWKLTIDNLTGNVVCNLDFKTKRDDDNLNQYIIKNAVEGTSDGVSQEDGDIVHETFIDSDGNVIDTGYRYEGKNPNNYIWFNNELWRIIGVFEICTELDDSGNCTKYESLTKIIRNESIGGLVWSKTNINNWPDSSLYALLNNSYLNSEDGTESGNCYGYQNKITSICDYQEIGLDGTSSYYGSMLKNVVWHLGGMSTSSAAENYVGNPASAWYTYERGNIVYSGRDTYTTGYVGLIYGSDYGYSVKANSCNRTTLLNKYFQSCFSQSWLLNPSYEWLLNVSSNSYNGIYANDMSYISNYSALAMVRPVVYLNSSVYIVSGDGSITNPYTLSM